MTEAESAVVNAVIAGLSKDVDSLTAERDALKVERYELLERLIRSVKWYDDLVNGRDAKLFALQAQLAAGDTARAALRDALEAFLNAANEYYLDSELTDSAPIQVVQRFLETRIVIQKLLAAERTTS